MQELGAGVNHFWIAVEPGGGARWGDRLDAELASVGPGGEVRVPEVGAPPGFLTVGNAVFSTILRKAGDDGVHTYRIPGLATTDRGTLIAVFDLRWDSAADLPANVDVGCMRSTDNGSTWHWATEAKAILDYDKTVVGSRGNGVGDPAVLVDRETGIVWVAVLWSFGNRGYTGSGAGLEITQTGQYVLTRSDDDGLDNGLNDTEADRDGDGVSNLSEFEAGTMANDPLSVLRFISFSLVPEGIELVWSSVPGMWYTVQGVSQLPGDWSPEPGGTNLAAGGGWLAHKLAVVESPQRFLRIVPQTRR